eukprot:TRINITY_DN1446_c0_g1_i1.p1 TRINITY_DN1446_c0_g1~~TRINITY_DN1446_c0_g1_i1.p1  ORF type:complete len:371 (+),score=110.62 TRINITY_DN1446_c0_g1_i1:45-1157(+)
MSIESAQSQVQSWIESTTGERFSGSFDEHLKNGVVLCNFINALRPNTILTINKYNAAFRQMQNIDNFLTVVSKLGVSDADRFKTEDLFYGNNIPKVVVTLVAFAEATRDKFPNNVDSSSLDGIRSVASSSQIDGKVRVVDSGLSIFETGMKKAQTEASAVARTNDRLVRKDMQEFQSTGDLGFIDAGHKEHQKMISAAKSSGQDLIIRSKDVAVASSDLGFIDSGHKEHQKMISAAKSSGQDLIIRSKDVAVASSDLGFIDSGHKEHQKMISAAKSSGQDLIIRSKDQAVASSDLGFIDSGHQEHQKMISDAKSRQMDNIIRSKDQAAVTGDLGYIDSNAAGHQHLISSANSEKLDNITRGGDVGGDINL